MIHALYSTFPRLIPIPKLDGDGQYDAREGTWSDFAPILVKLLKHVPSPSSEEVRGYCGLMNQDKHLLAIKPCLKSPSLRHVFKVLPFIPWFREEKRVTAFESWHSKGMHNVSFFNLELLC